MRFGMSDDIYTAIMARIRQENDCWTWTGGRNGDKPAYGRNKLNPRRILWEHEHGPLRRGKSIDMTCDNPMCVNPAHMSVPADHDHRTYQRERKRKQAKIARWREMVRQAMWRRNPAQAQEVVT